MAKPLHQLTPRSIWCCTCGCHVAARLTSGQEIYPHRGDLQDLPFWKCDQCANYVGCHRNSKNLVALGCIPTPQLRAARKQLHGLIDSIWQSGRMRRRDLYAAISLELGWKFHAGGTKTMEEVGAALKVVRKFALVGPTKDRDDQDRQDASSPDS